jgi:hypothetical protein
MVAADPHIARTRPDPSGFNHFFGRMNLHDDLFGMKRSSAHRYSEQRDVQKFAHV